MQSFTATPFLAAPKAASPAARCKRAVAARAEPERPKGSLFLGGVTDTAALSYLTGTLPGDKGCAARVCRGATPRPGGSPGYARPLPQLRPAGPAGPVADCGH